MCEWINLFLTLPGLFGMTIITYFFSFKEKGMLKKSNIFYSIIYWEFLFLIVIGIFLQILGPILREDMLTNIAPILLMNGLVFIIIIGNIKKL